MKDKVITTIDQRKWLVVNEVTFNGVEYLLVIGITDDKNDITEELKVVKIETINNQIKLVPELDNNILNQVCPLLEV